MCVRACGFLSEDFHIEKGGKRKILELFPLREYPFTLSSHRLKYECNIRTSAAPLIMPVVLYWRYQVRILPMVYFFTAWPAFLCPLFIMLDCIIVPRINMTEIRAVDRAVKLNSPINSKPLQVIESMVQNKVVLWVGVLLCI